MSDKTLYFSGLNGLRAISAIAVVVSHLTVLLADFNLNPYIFGKFSNGEPLGLELAGYGVTIFFVLSGFLITYLLQAEQDIQPIDIKKFYIRRVLRIWPLYYIYLAISILAILLFKLDLNYSNLIYYIFFAANVPYIFADTLPFLSHYWSLGAEEQFYLFWPLLNKKATSIFKTAIFLFVVILAIKLIFYAIYPVARVSIAIQFTRFQCMMIGAIGAILYKKSDPRLLAIADNKVTQSVCWLILTLVALNKYHLMFFIDHEIISVVALFLIIGQIQKKNRIINLENPLMNFIGKISFGIYVIHPLIIYLLSKVFFNLSFYGPFKYFLVFSTTIGITLLFAHLSYVFIEKYFLNFKRGYQIVKSSGSAEGQ